MEKRNTIQRELVLRAVQQLACHASVDEVYRHVSARYPSVSKGTVYRNLNILANEKRLLKVKIPGGAEHFDHNCHAHYHAYCKGCGCVYDVDLPPLPLHAEGLSGPEGFQVEGYELIFHGTCSRCRK